MKERLYKFAIALIAIPIMAVVIPVALIVSIFTSALLFCASLAFPVIALIRPDMIEVESPLDITFVMKRKE